MKDFSVLEKKLGLKFNNKDLIAQAFCHRSYLNENTDFRLGHNERLEFLGDAVLELVVTEYLYKKYPSQNEGGLTSWRAALVNGRVLSEISKGLGFDNFILLSRGEGAEAGERKQSILANAFESFIGALYLDEGYNLCQEFIERHLIVKLPSIIEAGLHRDFKSKLQEETQNKEKKTPTYRVLEESGPDHKKTFVIGVFVGEKLLATGQGYSKQEGEEKAAQSALEFKNNLN